MVKPFLKDILVDPENGGVLHYDENRNVLLADNGNIYSIKENVPVLLPSAISREIQDDKLHHDLSSAFQYIDHYIKDAEIFDYFAEHASAVTRDEIRRLEQVIISSVPKNADLILDVGCGNGWIAEHFAATRKVISMDLAPKNAVEVQLKFPSENHNSLVADVYHLPVRENSVDCIVAAEIIEHVADPGLFIKKLLKVLKPGGTLIITTPYKEKIEYYLCVHCNRPTPKNAHLHSFDEKKMQGFIPEGVVFNINTFSNKYMLKLRSYLITRFFPLRLWQLTDSVANKILKYPTRLSTIIRK